MSGSEQSTHAPWPPSDEGSAHMSQSDLIDGVPGFIPPELETRLPSQIITEMPAELRAVAPNHSVVPMRKLIEVPSQEELAAGSAYEGERGEFKDVARLLQLLQEFDPEKKLADPDVRKEMLAHADVEHAKAAFLVVNRALYPIVEGESNLSDQEVLLGSGEDDNYKVGFIGIHPDDADEVLGYILEGVQHFAAQDDLVGAGRLAAKALVPLQMVLDGNKRTARAFYELIGYGYDGTHYDQSAMRDRLAYTHEARNSLTYDATCTSNRIAYVGETMPEDIRQSYVKIASGWYEFNDRLGFRNALVGIEDKQLTERLIHVLQQDGLGTKYVIEASDPTLIKQYAETRDPAIIKTAIEQFCAGVDDTKAQSIIAIDRNERKQLMKRLIESSTGEKPLADVDFMGHFRPDRPVNIAA